MSSQLFDDLMAGFEELREWARGDRELRVTAASVDEATVAPASNTVNRNRNVKRPIKHSISLLLNSTGYSKENIAQLLPPFQTERETLVGLKWQPSYNGSQSWGLTVDLRASVTSVHENFLIPLITDLQEWIQSNMVPFFNRFPNAHGFVEVRFRDASIYFGDVWDYGWPTGDDVLTEFFQVLPDMKHQIDPTVSKEWLAQVDETGKWTLKARHRGVRPDTVIILSTLPIRDAQRSHVAQKK